MTAHFVSLGILQAILWFYLSISVTVGWGKPVSKRSIVYCLKEVYRKHYVGAIDSLNASWRR